MDFRTRCRKLSPPPLPNGPFQQRFRAVRVLGKGDNSSACLMHRNFLVWQLRGHFQLQNTQSKEALTTETAALGAQYEVSVLNV